MDKLFNSIFENSLRILVLLDVFETPQSFEILYVADFMVVYGKDFGIGRKNLQGESRLKAAEFFSRRELVRDSLKYIVLHGLAVPKAEKDGFVYSITPQGKIVCSSLESLYACEYREVAMQVKKAVSCIPANQIISFFTQKLPVTHGKEL